MHSAAAPARAFDVVMLDLDGRPSLAHFGDARGVEHQLLRLRGKIGHERVMGVRIPGRQGRQVHDHVDRVRAFNL